MVRLRAMFVFKCHLQMSPSNFTLIGGVKALNFDIVTEFACDRTIVAVAHLAIHALPLRPPAQPQARMAAIAIGAYGHLSVRSL